MCNGAGVVIEVQIIWAKGHLSYNTTCFLSVIYSTHGSADKLSTVFACAASSPVPGHLAGVTWLTALASSDDSRLLLLSMMELYS